MAHELTTIADVIGHYRRQTAYSAAGEYALLYEDLPDDVPALCAVLQNTILHMFWISEMNYGITHEQLKAVGRKICVEFSCSSAEERLRNIVELDQRPLAEPREPAARSVGCCRDYALTLTSILRHRGIPARVRTGVAPYLIPDGDRADDHYVTEYWDADLSAWRMADPQVDELQREAMSIVFDTSSFDPDRFLTGWRLVEALRTGTLQPNDVGFPPVNVGLTYGRNKLFADFVGVTGHELPVHSWWGIGEPESVEPGDEALMDRMIELLRGIDRNDPAALEEAVGLTAAHPRLKMPDGYSVPTYRSPLC
ncbi:transglutaminase-like domain-containing protein [Candidatus Bipolaricaulota bacterium]